MDDGAGRPAAGAETKTNDGETAAKEMIAKPLSTANLIDFQSSAIAMLDVGKCRCLLTSLGGFLAGDSENRWRIGFRKYRRAVAKARWSGISTAIDSTLDPIHYGTFPGSMIRVTVPRQCASC